MAGTRWVKLDVEYFTNPKAVRAGVHARAFHLAAICWCGAHLTDGAVPAEAIPLICATAGVGKDAVARCVKAGLLVEVDAGDYVIHDYLAMQDSRNKVETKRKAAAERLANWRAENGK